MNFSKLIQHEYKCDENKYDENKYDENKYNDSKYEQEKEYTQNKINIEKNKLANKQKIYLNNYKKSCIKKDNEKFITDNLFMGDEFIDNKIYSLISNPYQKKLNLINLILDSSLSLELKTHVDIIKFFSWLNPLTIEFKLASGKYNIKTIKYANREKILLQNSISKIDHNEHFVSNYINKIKKILTKSGIKYYYFEFKSKRFNKIKDIIWVFEKN